MNKFQLQIDFLCFSFENFSPLLHRMIQFFKLLIQKKISKTIVGLFSSVNQYKRITLSACSFCIVGAMMYLNEATLLHNVRRRYEKDMIYVRTNSHR